MHLSAHKPRVPAAQVASATVDAQAPSRGRRLLDRLHHRVSRTNKPGQQQGSVDQHGMTGSARHDGRPAVATATVPGLPTPSLHHAPAEAPASPGARRTHAFDYFHRGPQASLPATPALEATENVHVSLVPASTPEPSEGHHFFARFHRPASPAAPPAPRPASPTKAVDQAFAQDFDDDAVASLRRVFSADAPRPPATPTPLPASRHAALFDHLRHPFAAERAPSAPPSAPPSPGRARRVWAGYGSFAHHNAQAEVRAAAHASVAVARTAPAPTLQQAVGQVQVHTPALLLAPVRALDTTWSAAQARGQARLDRLLDAAAEADKPRALVRQYVRERCALHAGEKVTRGLLVLRDASCERGGRAAAGWVGRKVGQGVSWGVGGPLLLVARASAPPRALQAGNAAADLAAWPGHSVVTVVSVSLAALALACGGLAAGLGLAVGYVVAGAVLALVPTAVLHGWLRGRALERAAHHRAEATISWLRQHFGEAPMTPGPQLQRLEARPGAVRGARAPLSPAAWDALTAQDEGYAHDVAHAVAYVADAPDAVDDQVALAEAQMERSVARMPAPLRLLLGAEADGQLVEAHLEASHAIAEGRRHRNAERIHRQRLAAASAAARSETQPAPSPASVDTLQPTE